MRRIAACPPHRLRNTVACLAWLAVFSGMPAAQAMVVVREPLDDGVYACVRGSSVLYLECSPPAGASAEAFFARYLADAKDWRLYKDRLTVAVPFSRLNNETQKSVLRTLFPGDRVDRKGWRHTVVLEGEQGAETWWALAEWFTGLGTRQELLRQNAENKGIGGLLKPGDQVLIPAEMLPEHLRAPDVPELAPSEPPAEEEAEPPAAFEVKATGTVSIDGFQLEYGSDSQGAYAAYRLKKGEALYSAVVVRFTDYRENADIHQACGVIQKRSGIEDVCKMEPGQRVLIPVDMLSDRFQPEGSERRQAFDDIQKEAERIESERGRAKGKDLEGIVVILDPGHGGRDQGAAVTKLGLYEDELNYDMACRIKRLLESSTRAKVHITLHDPDQKDAPSSAHRFTHDQDEQVLTTPPYKNYDARVSAYMRSYVANAIYAKERAAGVPGEKIVFASIHCDCLYNERMRGAMVYVPGAQYRRTSFTPSGNSYNHIAEAKGRRTFKTTSAEARRDEALSRTFAAAFLRAMSAHDPQLAVHRMGDPIRNVIRQSGGRAYVPAVLNYTDAPTKVLIEAANMTNAKDQQRLADPDWRQWFAEAFVDALKNHYGS